MSYRSATKILVLGLALAGAGCVKVIVESNPSVERIETDVEMMRRAMADVRTIGLAFEYFAIDNNRYPVQEQPVLTIGTRELSPIRILADELDNFSRRLPFTDSITLFFPWAPMPA